MGYDHSEDVAAVRACFQQYQDFYAARDPENLDACMALFSSDPEIEVIGTGAITHGTDEWCDGPALVRALTEGDWQGWGDVRFEVDGASIHVLGDVAWLATTATVTMTYAVDQNHRNAVARAKQLLDGPGDDESRLREMLMSATAALHEAGRGEVYIWPVRFTSVLVREHRANEAGEWRFHQAHFSFPTLRFPDERWTELPRPPARKIDATAD